MSQGKSFSERIIDQDHLLRPAGAPDRVQHQKMILGAFGTLEISENIPNDAKHEPFVSGTRIVACRFSNGQPKTFKDQAPDVRGIAVKFFLEEKEIDLLVTNEGGRSHARNAAEFLDVSDILAAKAAKGTLKGAEVAVKDLIGGKIGPFEAARIGEVLVEETVLRHVKSLTTEAYWGSVVELGGKPIEYSLQPHPSTRTGTDADPNDENFLRKDLLSRLRKGPIRFNLCVQCFRDKDNTPVDDASVKWNAPLEKIGELEIASVPSSEDEDIINQMAFNPGNGFIPLGITKDRQEVYAAGAHNRGALSSDKVRDLFREKSKSSAA
jgi:catalase